MTQMTPKLGLKLYDVGVPDNQETFLQFRSDMAGVSGSNFTKIDDAVADMDDRIVAVESLKPIVKLEGTSTDNANYTATNSSVTTLYDGLIVDFIPNQHNIGTATLTINGGSTNTINKISSSGTVVNLDNRDLMAFRRYILEYNGTEWVLVNSTSADQVNVNGSAGSILVVDVDNSIAASSIPVADNKISGDNIRTDPASIFSDAGALSLTETLAVPGIHKGIEWDSTGRALNIEDYKVLPSDIEIDTSLRDNAGALGLSLTGTFGTYKGITFDNTGRAIAIGGKVKATEINHSARLAETGTDNAVLDLTPTGITSGVYKGLALDEYGRVTGTNNLIRGDEIDINNSLISTNGVLGVSLAPDSSRLGGELPSYYMPITSTTYVNTSGNQTVGGIKTFSSIPVLPSSNPTLVNQAVRKGYADTTYLGIGAKAADSDKLDGLDSTEYLNYATHVTKNAVQAIPHNTITKVAWQVATRDDLTMWSSGANTRLTIKKAGYYEIFFYAQLEGSTVGTISWSCLYVNNLVVHYAPPIDRNQYGNQLVLVFRGQYALNDYLEIGVNHDFGSNKNIVISILPAFSAVRIG